MLQKVTIICLIELMSKKKAMIKIRLYKLFTGLYVTEYT